MNWCEQGYRDGKQTMLEVRDPSDAYRQLEHWAEHELGLTRGALRAYLEGVEEAIAEARKNPVALSYQQVQAAALERRLGMLGFSTTGERLRGEVNENDPRYVHILAVGPAGERYLGDVLDTGAQWIAYPGGFSIGEHAFASPVEAAKYLALLAGARKRNPMKKPKTKSELLTKIYNDDYLSSYFETALWSSTDDEGRPLDEDHDVEDIEFKSLKAMVEYAEDFLDHPGVREAIDASLGDYSQAGHDFWLTRNHHGAGFWDGDWAEPQASFLTDVAHSYGGVDLYVGDSGKIYSTE